MIRGSGIATISKKSQNEPI